MVQLAKVGNTPNVPYEEYLVDSTSEIDLLPQIFGTRVLNLEDGFWYVCNSEGVFKKVSK